MADDRIPELVIDLEDKLIELLLSQLSIDRQKAREIAYLAARHITDEWGGQLIYIPKNQLGKLSERDIKIWKESNGRNHTHLAKNTVSQYNRFIKFFAKLEDASAQNRSKIYLLSSLKRH